MGVSIQITTKWWGSLFISLSIFVLVFGYVALSAEFAIGRRANTGTLGAYEYAWNSRNLGVVGKFIGFLPLIGSLCIALGYAVIISYVAKALGQSITGTLMSVDSGKWFEQFSGMDYSVVPYHAIILFVTLLTCIKGADSIEKSNKIMMPAFFVLFLILMIRVAMIPGAFDGYTFYVET